MDYRKCPLLHLAVYFESLADRKRNPKTDTFGFENPYNEYLAVRRALNTIIDSKCFQPTRLKPLKTYSITKGRVTDAVVYEFSKDNMNHR